MFRFVTSSIAIGSLLSFAQLSCSSSPPAQSPEDASGSNALEPAGTPVAPQKPQAENAGSCPGTALIDDFEDGDNRAVIVDGRGGYWYTYKDVSSTVSPEGTFAASAGGAEESSFSGRMSGTVGTEQYPYVGMGVSLTEPKAPYDASCCSGVSFWGKKNGEGIGQVRLKVGDWQTSPEGGACKDCYNDFGADFTFTEEWQKYEIEFSDMQQEPYWGEPKPSIESSAIYQLQWQVKEVGAAFDIQVDQVEFVGCKSSG